MFKSLSFQFFAIFFLLLYSSLLYFVVCLHSSIFIHLNIESLVMSSCRFCMYFWTSFECDLCDEYYEYRKKWSVQHLFESTTILEMRCVESVAMISPCNAKEIQKLTSKCLNRLACALAIDCRIGCSRSTQQHKRFACETRFIRWYVNYMN